MASVGTTEDVFTGVPSTYEDLYGVFLFLVVLYIMGDVVCQRGLKIVPSLVGYIASGVAFGPEGWDWVPMDPESWVLLGNLGLVLLITQAGLEMDLEILNKIGVRGFVIAVIGSILPISLGMLLSWAVLNQSGTTVVAMGCCFGPTSAGIAINVLGKCHVLEAPLGQLIVAAAIVDDILALLVLSQLQALVAPEGDVSVPDIAVPIVSAFAWLFVGGALALFAAPKCIRYLFRCTQSSLGSRIIQLFRIDPHHQPDENRDNMGFSVVAVLGLLACLLPATNASQASYLLGAFLAGLAFCQEEGLDECFRKEFQRLIDWLMRIFFAATIGFQVPLSLFGDGKVIANGLILSLSLLGKVAVGPLLTPIFDDEEDERTSNQKTQRWRGRHLRDCAVVGFSMAGEAEFAFVLAVYGVTEGLIPPDLYASVVLAILLSTIWSPIMLRIVLAISPYKADNQIDLNAASEVSDDNSEKDSKQTQHDQKPSNSEDAAWDA